MFWSIRAGLVAAVAVACLSVASFAAAAADETEMERTARA